MEKIIWFIVMIPCSLLFTGLGIYAWRREKPMWFWSGSTVRDDEISDIPAYNRENGIMWICYSLIFWAGTFMGFWKMSAAGIVIVGGCIIGVPFLVLNYNRIYRKYRR